MKKLYFFLLLSLILVGCSKNESLGEKECINYRNNYMQYVMDKYSIIAKKDYDGKSTKNILRSFEMFYSEPFEKCIAAYAYDEYESTINGPDAVTRYFYIDDAFKDDFMRYGTCNFYYEGCADTWESFYNWKVYYRTGKGEPRNTNDLY